MSGTKNISGKTDGAGEITAIPVATLAEQGFSEKEIAIIQLILFHKIQTGLHCRMMILANNTEEVDGVVEIDARHQCINGLLSDTTGKIAAFLGIGRERYLQLIDFVFENETTL